MQRATQYLLSLFLIPVALAAQDATFVASVGRSAVGAGEQFEVSFTLSGGNVSGARNFQSPDFSQFVVLSGPNQSTSMQIINGQFSGSVTYSYILYARQPGKYTIASASVELRGATLKSSPITVEVTQGRPQQSPLAGSGASSQVAQNIGENLFIRATVNKSRVLRGEQITVTYKLYTRLTVSGYDISKAPAYEGFWAEDIEQPRQPTVNTEMYEGKEYRVALIRRTALFPTQAGQLIIAPLEVRCGVQTQAKRPRGADPFGSFFNDPFFQGFQTVEYDFKSNTVTVTVDPLPTNAPASFSGAVGTFTLNASVDKNEVQAGDPITVRLSVSGVGNVKLLTLPRPELQPDMEAYEPKITDEITREGGVIRGKKSADYLIVSRNPGQRSIESIPFTYFDIAKKQYATLRTPRLDINIKPGREALSGTPLAAKSDVKLLGEDIRFLKITLGDLKRKGEAGLFGVWFYAAILVPPLLFVGSLVYRKRMERLYGDLPKRRSQKAGREAAKRLKKANKVLANGDTQTYHAEISKALIGYLRDKLQIPPGLLTIDEALTRLEQRGLNRATTEELRLCIERAEFVRFAPSEDTQEARRDLIDTAANIIQTLEKTLNGRA